MWFGQTTYIQNTKPLVATFFTILTYVLQWTLSMVYVSARITLVGFTIYSKPFGLLNKPQYLSHCSSHLRWYQELLTPIDIFAILFVIGVVSLGGTIEGPYYRTLEWLFATFVSYAPKCGLICLFGGLDYPFCWVTRCSCALPSNGSPSAIMGLLRPVSGLFLGQRGSYFYPQVGLIAAVFVVLSSSSSKS